MTSTRVRHARLGPLDAVVEPRADGTTYVRSPHALGAYATKLTERLAYWALHAPARTFLAQRALDGRWRTLTYADALARTRRIAQALLDRGLSEERPIAILSGNGIEHGLLALAAMYAGIPYAPIAPAYSLIAREFGTLRYLMDSLRPGLVYAADGNAFANALRAVANDDLEIVVGASVIPNEGSHAVVPDQGVRLLVKRSIDVADFKESDPLNMLSSRASGASRGICTSAVQSISALQLAAWIRDGRRGLRVLDIRDPAAYATRHIPSAESAELMELSSVAPQAGETVVLYSDDDLLDLQGAAWLTRAGHARVHVVRGGMSAWLDEVIDPVVQGDSAATVAALSRYFGGVPRAASASDARTRARVRRTTGRLELVTRRGC
jgi:rhodanese-related sulfurtransferase